MQRIDVKRWIPTVLWAGVMLFLSRQQGEDTLRLSRQLSIILTGFLARLGIVVNQQGFHHTLRKVAHFCVYSIWAMLLYGAICANDESAEKKNLSALFSRTFCTMAICAVVAVLDELQKKWIHGRHCNWEEVVINLVGALTGTAMRMFIFLFN